MLESLGFAVVPGLRRRLVGRSAALRIVGFELSIMMMTKVTKMRFMNGDTLVALDFDVNLCEVV